VNVSSTRQISVRAHKKTKWGGRRRTDCSPQALSLDFCRKNDTFHGVEHSKIIVSKLNFPDRLQGRMNFEIGLRLNLLSEERRLVFISCRDMKAHCARLSLAWCLAE
jgi:hypothetical protein